jgi:hypothetical protein
MARLGFSPTVLLSQFRREHPDSYAQYIRTRAWLLPILLGMLLRLVWLIFHPHEMVHDEVHYHVLAEKLARGESYGVPFWPPAWPGLVALLYVVLGVGTTAPLWLNLVASAGTVVLVGVISRRLFGDAAAIWALWIAALMPSYILSNVLLIYEVLLQFLLSLCVAFAIHKGWSWTRTILVMLITALLTLMRPFWLIMPVLLWTGHRLFTGERVRYNHLIVAQLGAMLLIVPWLIYASSLAGRFVPVSLNGGVNLWIGNNPNATGTHISPPGEFWDPRNDALARDAALEYIRNHPVAVIQLIPAKIWYFMRMEAWIDWIFLNTSVEVPRSVFLTVKGIANLYYWVVLAASITSIVLLARRRAYWLLVPLLLFLYNAASYMPFTGQLKYRWPLQFVLIVYAAALPLLLNLVTNKDSSHANSLSHANLPVDPGQV